MSRFKTTLRRLRTLLWTAMTLLILLAAVLVGIGKLLMPYSQRYQPQLEEWLSREFQQPVVVGSFSGEWKAFGPRISFEGVTLMGDGSGEGEIAIQRAALDVKPLNLILPNRPLYSFHIIGADLSLIRSQDGRFELSGLGVSGRESGGSDGGGLGNLARVGELRLEDSSLGFEDQERGIQVQLTGIRGRLQMNGAQLSTELEADISDRLNNRVLGDLKATLLITLGDDQRLSKARWHVKTGELMIEELARQLPQYAMVPRSGWLNAEVWGDWSRGESQVMQGVLDVRESLLSEQPEPLQLDHLNTRFRWNFENRKSWRVDLSDLVIDQGGRRWQTARLSLERNIPGNLGLWVSSDDLELEFPLELTSRITSSYNTRWPKSMPRKARGSVKGFDLVLDHRWKMYLLKGQLDGVDAWEWGEGRYPDVAGIDGTMNLQGGEGQIDFSGSGIRLDWPRNFRSRAIVDIPACTMEITWGRAWALDAHDCVLSHEQFSLSGRARFAKSENKPVMDVNILFQRANLAALDDYWPQSVMSDKVINWLGRGIVEGTASSGRYSMRGDLDDFPFRGNEGILLAQADISGAALDYAQGWPVAAGMELETRFRNTSMDASGSVASMAGVPIASAHARVGDFKDAVLELDYNSRAPLPALLGFIEQTPLLADTELDLAQFRFEGDASTSGQLVAPLGQASGTLEVNGKLELSGNRFTELRSGLVLDQLEGDIRYDREGMSADALSGVLRGHAARIGLASDWDADEVFSATVSGQFPVNDILPASLVESEPMLSRIAGMSGWRMNLSVASPAEGAERETWLEMSSELQGVEIALPAPMDKSAESSWPTLVRYPVRADNRVLTVDVRDRLYLQFELGQGLGDAERASIFLGPGQGELPGPGLMEIGGNAALLDVDGWMDLVIERFRQDRPDGALGFEKASLEAAELHFLNRSFSEVQLDLEFTDGVLRGDFDSESLSGDMNYRRSVDGHHTLSAQLDRFYLPEPLDDGVIMETEPSTLPEMHFYARDFRYQGLELGETRIEAFPLGNGFRIDSLEAVSPRLNFQARGEWIRDGEGDRSDFDIMMTSESLGSLIDMMNASSVLEGGQTVLHYDAWWHGTPAAFALARLNGEMTISVIDGKILNADAGAGRMVGLLSVAALPRRLALDFRDVFGSGFNFDQAHGTITLGSGMAVTEDLVLESTAATMAISGSSDLVNKEFDYQLVVRPGVSQTLPAIGAVIGGPGGAAAGLALQGLLRKSLGDATEAIYTITGPWSSPQVEPVGQVPSTTGQETGNPAKDDNDEQP